MVWKGLLLLGLWCAVAGDLEMCETELRLVLERFFTLVPNDTYSEMASYSGRWLGDFGNYFDCIDLKAANYALFIISASGLSMFYSLCGPQSCSAADYQLLLSGNTTEASILALATDLNRGKVRKLLWKSAVKAEEVEMEVVFPQHYIHEHFGRLNAGAIVMLVICVILGVVMAAGTIIDLNGKFEWFGSGKERRSEEKEGLVRAKEGKRERWVEVLVCFSVYTNYQKLLAARSGSRKDTLEILNGIRVMSMGWVILGHVYDLRAALPPVKNPEDLPGVMKKSKTAFIYGAYFSVDTFFWMSGMLMAYLLAQQLDSSRGIRWKGWVYLYFHRLYRILPAYMFVLFMCWAFTKYMGNGPLWIYGDYFNNPCRGWWWTNLLFLNNFIPSYTGSDCMDQSWYLANDMQFFWVSPPVFYLYSKVSQRLGWVFFTLGVLLTMVCSAVLADIKDYNVVVLAHNTATENADVYVKPYCRVAPYAIGIICGLILYTHRNYAKTGKIYDNWAFYLGNLLENRYIRYSGYLLGLFLINFFIFIQFTAYRDVDHGFTSWTHAENVLFYTFERVCWGVGVSLLFLPMLMGHWKVGTWVLSLDVWTPLARLTFCTYLVHIHLATVFFASENSLYWFNDLNVTKDFLFITAVSYAAAIPLTLAVESPCMAIEKLLKTPKNSSK